MRKFLFLAYSRQPLSNIGPFPARARYIRQTLAVRQAGFELYFLWTKFVGHCSANGHYRENGRAMEKNLNGSTPHYSSYTPIWACLAVACLGRASWELPARGGSGSGSGGAAGSRRSVRSFV